jgi:chromosome segregation protein
MADVALAIDNADGLFPVDYAVVELGRRLYRSGEAEYLLNRQVVRWREIAGLLEEARLAENAFLFIGQGMVDQALALRPEERRPLFEEVAGVARHQRRRRRAEEQLAEAEANLARLADLAAELRPQVRRLAAQAEQEAVRRRVAEELVEAVLLVAHQRWWDLAARLAAARETVSGARRNLEDRRRERSQAEAAVAEASAALEAADAEASRLRRADEEAAAQLAELEVRRARLAGELGELQRRRERLATELAAQEAEVARQEAILARPLPDPDPTLDAELAAAEAALADALAELEEARAELGRRAEAEARARRAGVARLRQMEAARDRLRRLEATRAEAWQRKTDAEAALAAAEAELATASRRVEEAEGALEAASEEVRRWEEVVLAARREAEAATEAVRSLGERLAASQARLADLDARLAAATPAPPGSAVEAPRRVAEGLVVEPSLADAVAAALGEAAAALVVDGETAHRLATEDRGQLLALEPDHRPGPADPPSPAEERLLAAVAAHGGGLLAAAVREDPTGVAQRLLSRAAWVPDLAIALELRPLLPPGWQLVTRDGRARLSGLLLRLGRSDAAPVVAARREAAAAIVELQRTLAAATARQAEELATLQRAEASLSHARRSRATAQEEQRRSLAALADARRRRDAAAGRAAWEGEAVARLDRSIDEARQVLLRLEDPGLWSAEVPPGEASPAGREGAEAASGLGAGDRWDVTAWEARVAAARSTRDRLAAERAARDAEERRAGEERAAAEARRALAEERIADLRREAEELEVRRGTLERERDEVEAALAAARQARHAVQQTLSTATATMTSLRHRLSDAEALANAARTGEREAAATLEAAQEELETVERAAEAVQRQVAVELASLGSLARRILAERFPGETVDLGTETGEDGWEELVERLTADWEAAPPPELEVPAGRLALLRRRFLELGTANPMAEEEHRLLASRLAEIEGQAADLRGAIATLRRSIADLDRLIAEEFQAAFRRLQIAFEARFRQLFGGGSARLELTAPQDLAATGVEIVARPPGKRAQPLAMLSGGERALTAVALLFAMLEVRPVPFCVLDEVDAALDEANVGRFVDALRELARTIQFIVITHNRGTIEAADALYGVTVGDDSVSRVVSLRLEDARALVAAEAAADGRS